MQNTERIRVAALSDPKISDGAFRLLCGLLSASSRGEFPLSYRDAGKLCGLTDKATIYGRIHQLCPKYLKPLGVKGCPPIAWFKINF